MSPILNSLVWAMCLLGGMEPETTGGSYLNRWIKSADGISIHQSEPYVPQAGDLVLYDDHSKTWRLLYNMVGTEPPDHSGIVIALPNGAPGLLESGPDNGIRVRIMEALPRWSAFQGTIWIRRVKRPLTSEQSKRLTEFALSQEGKRYAWGRLLLQGTPFCCRGPWREKLFGKTYLDRSSWLCSELVVAAGTVAGLFDPNVHRANTMYPRDIVYDDIYDLRGTWYPSAVWSASPGTPVR